MLKIRPMWYLRSFLMMLICAYGFGALKAQPWQRVYDAGGEESWVAALPHESGGWAVAGYRYTLASGRQGYFAIVDQEGSLLTTATLQLPGFDLTPVAMQRLSDGNFALGANALSSAGVPRMFYSKLDADGQTILQVLHNEDSTFVRSLEQTAQGICWMAGSRWNRDTGVEDWDAYLWAADTDGQTLWTYRSGLAGAYDEFFDLVPLPSGDCLALGTRYSTVSGTFDLLLVQFDASGQVLWTSQLDLGGNELGQSLAVTPAGDILIAAKAVGAPDALLLIKTDAAGQVLWSTMPDHAAWVNPKDLLIRSDGQISVVGDLRQTPNGLADAFLYRADEHGQTLGWSTYGGYLGDQALTHLATSGGFLLAGASRSFGNGDLDAYLVHTGADGALFSSQAEGVVFQDLNGDCQQQTDEPVVAGVILSLQNIATGLQTYGVSDALGHYALQADTGQYLLSVVPPGDYWQACQQNWPISLDQIQDTVTQKLGITPYILCPQLYVEAAVPFLRRCFSNTYVVNYGNVGSVASPGTIQVVLDPYFAFENSDPPPISQSGDTLVYDVGVLNPFEQGQIHLTVSVDCDSTVLGQTHCLYTHISPDTLCLPPPSNWDGSNLVMNAQCVGDSVVVVLLNNGAGNMSVAANYLVIEDQIMLRGGAIQLLSGQDTTLVFYPNGNTLILLAEQTPGNPNPQQPIVVVEGCGGAPFSTGFALQFPYPDAEPATDIDCRANVGSYDPNQKEAQPQGFGEGRAIEAGQRIDYLIQFQNIGTDTAFRVVIRDTLSPWLLPASIRMGPSSHPYSWELTGEGVIKIQFNPIALPDSASNAQGSTGFVRFSVDANPLAPEGALLENRAGIYFDWNEPIMTNVVQHTIGFNWVISHTDKERSKLPKFSLRVSPNPVRSAAWVDWSGDKTTSYELSLYNTQGHCLWQNNQVKFPFLMDNVQLPGGAYVLVLSNHQHMLAATILLIP